MTGINQSKRGKMTKSKILLWQARSHVTMARLQKINGVDFTHHLNEAKKCVKLAQDIERVEKTITMRIKIAS